MRNLASIVVLLFIITISPAVAEEQKYTCPMHPHYIATEAGTCPICGMDLVPMEDEEEEDATPKTATTGEGKKKILYWVAPMDPNYRMDKPGKSPMGMDLVPVYGTDDDSDNNKGRSTVRISPEIIQNTGVRTENAMMARFGTGVRSYGLVAENIRLQQDISSRVAGWIEDLEVTAVGDEVKKGDLLFTLYSPELVSAQQDYIAALATRVTGRINSAAKRLTSLGVQEKVLDDLKNSRQKLDNVPFYAVTDGIVSKLNVKAGTYVKSGMQIAEIQDYSSVWVNVSIAEKDLQFLTKNSKATVTFPNLGDEERTGRIDYIYPTIDAASRTGQIRLVLGNSEGVLKPGAYADVEFETNVEKRLSVPSEAVLKSSEGDFVIIAKGEGRFQPRRIKIGITSKGRSEVLTGLKEGDAVVVSSQFMIDSESALRESFRKLQKAQMPLSQLEVGTDELAMINHLIDAAIYMQQSLTGNVAFDRKMLAPVLKLNDYLIPKFRGTQLQFILEDAERAISGGKESITDEELRNALSDLMMALKPWLLQGRPGYYKEKGLSLFMDKNSGNLWLQLESKPANPYGDGQSMLHEWPAISDIEAAPGTLSITTPSMEGGAHAGH